MGMSRSWRSDEIDPVRGASANLIARPIPWERSDHTGFWLTLRNAHPLRGQSRKHHVPMQKAAVCTAGVNAEYIGWRRESPTKLRVQICLHSVLWPPVVAIPQDPSGA